jgi:hypothetical protein
MTHRNTQWRRVQKHTVRIVTRADFKQHQYEFTAHLRDPDNTPAPAGVEERRMKIYRELLYNNIEGFLGNGFPVIRSIYNDTNWHAMVRDFFARHKSRSPYFLDIAQEFLDYLQHEREHHAEDPAGLLELAHYEWVELALAIADETIDISHIDPNGDLLDGHPVLSDLAWPLVYSYPVHEMGPDHLPESAPAQPTYLVVYRNRNDEVKFMALNPVTARLLDLLLQDETMTGRQAIEQIIIETGHIHPEVVMKGGSDALEELRAHGIILGTARQ